MNPALTRELAEAAQCRDTLVCAVRQEDGFHLALHLAEHRIEHLVPYSRRNHNKLVGLLQWNKNRVSDVCESGDTLKPPNPNKTVRTMNHTT